ncbi:MAG: Holliday junction resolvase [Candidatus Huberarchaeum crystalense]|uniref:Holliday junction resolvase n=1 Tax=Huberarchaeum crystalense TaxID=2014257 RepID=A0A2G9LKS4_HUBC1|nr:Holliday junction resolvase [archaeon]OIP20459.1 MAG: hypothetical protein AUJ91_01255 [archaeon CG2_30_31_98]PIN66760.1 MAG: Holliday junction resolvase [Candidatus Huberarchaeum crystalense]NCS98348.1 Holliday junction resolvase [archaeon]PIV13802.1 MAG: Holliday junction resolvase [Candidatus Huberarchaeum crystalense]
MWQYQKGVTFERQLFKRFWDSGWAAMRAAGSGDKKVPDIIAGNGKKLIIVECKTINDDHIYLKKDDVEKLILFGLRIKAWPLICVKFKGNPEIFYAIEDLQYTKNNCCKLSVQQKGLSFDEINY